MKNNIDPKLQALNHILAILRNAETDRLRKRKKVPKVEPVKVEAPAPEDKLARMQQKKAELSE